MRFVGMAPGTVYVGDITWDRDRILRSYSDFDNKPIFYSEVDYFLVTLPNRSIISGLSDVTSAQQNVVTSAQEVASSAQEVASSAQEVASSAQEVVTSAQEVASSAQEVIDFIERVESNTKWTRATKERIIMLFKKYRYGYTFNRRNLNSLP